MADYYDHAGVLFASSAYGHNIFIFLEIENFSICITRMQFFLDKL